MLRIPLATKRSKCDLGITWSLSPNIKKVCAHLVRYVEELPAVSTCLAISLHVPFMWFSHSGSLLRLFQLILVTNHVSSEQSQIR